MIFGSNGSDGLTVHPTTLVKRRLFEIDASSKKFNGKTTLYRRAVSEMSHYKLRRSLNYICLH